MGDTLTPDATLRNVHFEDWGDSRVAIGAIYGDRKARFPDGMEVHTSAIVSGPDANGIIRTLNSVYLIDPRTALERELLEALRWYAMAGGTASMEDVARGDVDLSRASEALTEDCGDIARAAIAKATPSRALAEEA